MFLQRLCRDDQRLLVGFTNHERDVFRLGGDDLHDQAVRHYRDARPSLFEGLTEGQRRSAKRGKRTLDFYRGAYGLPPLPPHLRGRKVGPWIGDIHRLLMRRTHSGEFVRGPAARGKWTKLRQRNERDCRDLRDMCLMATAREEQSVHRFAVDGTRRTT